LLRRRWPLVNSFDMPHRPLIGLLVLACLFVRVCDGIGAQGVDIHVSSPAITERPVPHSAEERAPQKAYDLLAELERREGKPLRGYVGGQIFQNRERRLPQGRYREYDVDRKIPGRSRGSERLVIEQATGKAYYTGDHYRSFVPLN
jgi:ribonuclease T1